MTVREALAEAAAEANRWPWNEQSHPLAKRARARRNTLMAYAYQRGATVREIGAICGLTSTSTVHDILRRQAALDRPDAPHVFDEPAPEPEVAA